MVELFSSAFCAPCRSARAVLERAGALVPALRVQEVDVAADVERARAAAVTSTPTLLVRDAAGAEVFRAAGVPTLPQLLVALDRAGLTPGR
ncbi:thioredoxin family protein [Kineococcus vitellinus]|uniref:thioredoxin family protein n=1 Tax=Kineococcus vitellinus TaxID=2696565 RepID=UPI0030B801CE